MAVEALPVAGVAPASGMAGPPRARWTYEDLLALPEDGNRYEIIDGVLYVAPPPSPGHQDRLLNLCYWLSTFIRGGHGGQLFISPIGLLMPGASPVQPDAFYLAAGNPAQIDWARHVQGVPDLVIEVASPSTAGYDRREKQDAYARAGVPEYWIVDPIALTIELMLLDCATGRYQSQGLFAGESLVPSPALRDLPYTVTQLLS